MKAVATFNLEKSCWSRKRWICRQTATFKLEKVACQEKSAVLGSTDVECKLEKKLAYQICTTF